MKWFALVITASLLVIPGVQSLAASIYDSGDVVLVAGGQVFVVDPMTGASQVLLDGGLATAPIPGEGVRLFPVSLAFAQNRDLLLLSRPSNSNLDNSSRLTRISAVDGSASEMALIANYVDGISRFDETLFLAATRMDLVGEVLAFDLVSSTTEVVSSGVFGSIPVGIAVESAVSLTVADGLGSFQVDIATGVQTPSFFPPGSFAINGVTLAAGVPTLVLSDRGGSVGSSVVELDPDSGPAEVFHSTAIETTAVGAFPDGSLLIGYQEDGSGTRTLAAIDGNGDLTILFTTENVILEIGVVPVPEPPVAATLVLALAGVFLLAGGRARAMRRRHFE